MSAIKCPNCSNEAPQETFETAFEVLGGFMGQPVIKCKECSGVLMQTGRFRKKWTHLSPEAAKMIEPQLASARERFQAGEQDY